MSITGLRNFIRGVAEGQGYQEHEDPFTFETLAQSEYEEAFHIDPGQFVQISRDQKSLASEYRITLRLFFRGFNKVGPDVDDAYDAAETIVGLLTNHDAALGNSNFKLIDLTSLAIVPLSDENQRDFIVEIGLSAQLNLCVSD